MAATGRRSKAAAIITVPLGVLKAGADETDAIDFDPDIREKRSALERIGMASVTRIARGAYSYQMVGVSDGRRRQGACHPRAAPPRDPLFAGEATDPEGRTGTVPAPSPPVAVPPTQSSGA